jgi:FkbM family methyltransferase
VVGSAARIVQRRMRRVAPGTAARLTWEWASRRDGLSARVVDRFVSEGDAVLDIGANWGLYTARLAHLVGRSGQVDAFEPHPAHAPTLDALARRRPQIAVHKVGLADTPGTATLHVPVVRGRDVTALSSLTAPAGDVEHRTVEVTIARLDDEIAGRRPPTFVKCDVEGLELAVLHGGERTLKEGRPALLVEIEQRHQERPIADTFRYLAELGYEGHYFARDALVPLDRFDVERDQLAHLGPGVVEYGMPEGYVADFLFVAPGTDVSRLT